MKTLVTGGCGFIGSHLVDNLVSSGHQVIVIDDLSAPQNDQFYFNESASYFKKDISIEDCSELFKDVDCVFHLAARSRIQPTIDSPNECFSVNLVGTQKVLEWCRKNGVNKIIYSSTSSLYGTENSLPFHPNMPTNCLNPYSLSKWMGELVCKLYTQLFDMDTVVLRYFNVYGPREPLRGQYAPVVGLFKRQHKSGKKITVVGSGNQRRDFTYIDDVVEANIVAMNCKDISGNNTFNIGTGKNYSILELVNMIAGKDYSNIEYLPPRPAEVFETLADIQKTVEFLGWKPRFNLEEKINSY